MAHAMPMTSGIRTAIEVAGGASQVRPDLRGHLLHGVEPLRPQEHVGLMDGSHRGGYDDRLMMVGDRDTFFPCPRRVPRLSHFITPVVATVLVPSPWSTLISRGVADARWATRAMHACHSDPSAARVVKTVETVVSWMAGCPRASVGTAKPCHGLPVERPHTMRCKTR
jgi:hypothetical protein